MCRLCMSVSAQIHVGAHVCVRALQDPVILHVHVPVSFYKERRG